MSNDDRMFLEIEEEFQNDSNGKKKDKLVQRFKDQMITVKTAMDKGGTREEFQHLEKWKKALESSIYIAERSWIFNNSVK